MLSDMLLIDFDPFAKESRVIHVENNKRKFITVSSDINKLAKQLPVLCQEYNLYDMRINAPLNFFYELKRLTEQEEKNQYNENKIHMETC